MNDRLVRLDGGLATELQRAGLAVRDPWWTTLALNADATRTMLRTVHERYLAAGADVVTANTFRCNLRALQRIGLENAGLAWMVHAAVGVALAARNAQGSDALIAGSMAPVEDCYRPDLVPPDEELATEHRWLATELMRAGVDVVAIETMNSAREARIALEQVQQVGGRAWVGFVCTGGAQLLSGERLAAVARAAELDGAEAVLVNCTTPADTEVALAELRDTCSGPIGAYPNIEDRDGSRPWTHVDHHLPSVMGPEEFAELIERWRTEFGLGLVGGCCGTTPDHLAAAYAWGAGAAGVTDVAGRV